MKDFILFLLCLLIALGFTACSQHSVKEKQEQKVSQCEAWETTDMGLISIKKFEGFTYVQYTGGDQHPLGGVTISLISSSKTETLQSDQDGHFSKSDLSEGTYKFEACKDGFNAVVGTVAISKNAEKDNFKIITQPSS